VISAAENSSKFSKTRFWKEKSVEDMVRLGPTAQARLVSLNASSFAQELEVQLSYVPNQSEKLRKIGNQYWDLITKGILTLLCAKGCKA
jgi:hypothetical protein